MSTAFGAELLRRRTERGMSLAQLAKLVPCHRGYIAQLESGERRPSPAFARKLDEALEAAGRLVALTTDDAAAATDSATDDEFEAMEFGRRVAASDLGSTTLAA